MNLSKLETNNKQSARRAPALAAVERGYCVAKRRPLSDLPLEKQIQIREAYKDTDWASEYCLELQGFFTDLALAVEAAKKYPGGLVITLPVNACLPDELGRYGAQDHPNSNSSDWYLESNPRSALVQMEDLEKLHSRIGEVSVQVATLLAIAT